jgi:hypothetical protein
LGLASFDTLIAEFLAAEKLAIVRPRWAIAQHPDYAEFKMRVGVANSRILAGRVILAAHRTNWPPKYCFSLLFRGQRILGLDVGPRRFHKNLFAPTSVSGTHWQFWPRMEAKPDVRDLSFAEWLRIFLREAKVSTSFVVLSPPRGVQMRLPLDGEDPNSRRR